jgi:Secretion system C-terminal sorting domain
MNILDNGDLIFAGRGRDTLLDSFFFTYRTDPDGYHPDGQYVGIQEVLVSPTEIGIFPNPSDGLFEISSMSYEKITVDVFDEQGKLILSSELPNPSDNSTFDLRNQPPGVYFAHISQGELQWVKKLVVR